MTFFVGQKVVCVKPVGVLRLNAVYRIARRCPVCVEAGIATDKYLAIDSVGVPHANGVLCNEWRKERFRPLFERKNDAQAFVENLKKICAPENLDAPRKELVE